MEENTTTVQPTEETGAEALPVETAETQSAAVETSESSESSQEAENSPDADEKLQKYAKSQGLELGSPSEIKAAQIAMKAQSEATRNYQKASELEKTLTGASDEVAEQVAEQTGQDPEVLKRLQRMEVKEAVRDFWSVPNDDGVTPDRSLEPKMIELLSEKPHLAGDLDSLYAVAVAKSGKFEALKSEGKREALETLAHKQQAAVPTGSATNSGITPKSKPFAELSIKEMEAQLGFHRR